MYVGYQMPKELRKVFADPCLNGGMFSEGAPNVSIPSTILFLEKVGAFKDNSLKFICVGDVVSKAFYNNKQLRPLVKYFIIDGETQRGTVQFSFDTMVNDSIRHMKFKNHPGTISAQIMQFMKQARHDGQQYFVEIDGEEDLLVVPAVLFPLSNKPHFVFYGQPPQTDQNRVQAAGLVILWTIQRIREINSRHFKKFTRIEQ